MPNPPLSEVVAESRLPGMDGLRAIGLFGVIVAHSVFAGGLPADFGPTAFFVLSGFLITRLLVRERQRTGTVSIRRFYLRRTMRIFPAYYAFLVLSYFLDERAGQRWSSTFLTNAVTYTINYFNAFNHHPATSLAHAWSLAVEEQFYLLWPLAFIVLAARGRRTLITGVILAALSAMAWRSWLVLHVHVETAYIYNAFETRFDNLAVGCLLAIVIDQQRVLTVAKWCANRSWFPFITVALLFASRVLLPSSYHFSVGLTVDSLLIGIFITQMLQLYRTRLWSWLETPVVRYLGAISYPMYLYHAWGASVGRLIPGSATSVEFVAGVLATVLLGTGSFYIIERPFQMLRARHVSNAWEHIQLRPRAAGTRARSPDVIWTVKQRVAFMAHARRINSAVKLATQSLRVNARNFH